jgi:hypothetical protein
MTNPRNPLPAKSNDTKYIEPIDPRCYYQQQRNGNAGRYISMANGPIADKSARTIAIRRKRVSEDSLFGVVITVTVKSGASARRERNLIRSFLFMPWVKDDVRKIVYSQLRICGDILRRFILAGRFDARSLPICIPAGE